MPFSHSVYPFSKEDYLAEIGRVLNDAETLVFLDTNVLGYLFKLLGAARNEFFTWTDRLIIEDRLKIPAWVLSEYLAKLKNKKLGEYTAQSSEPDEIRKKLENLHRMASLFVDEQVLKGIGFTGDRQKYLAEFEKAIKGLTPFTGAFKRQFDAATIHSEIAARLSPAVLASNIGELCARAGREGDVRQSHRMPPGYKDAGKDENNYGDLIIWFEILEFAQANKDRFQKTVILTNDAKADWVYAPEHRMETIKGVAKALPNKDPQINLPDPRLVAEFQAVVGHRDFYIVSLPVFVEALVKISGAGLHNLASAIQVEVETREEADRERIEPSTKSGESSGEDDVSSTTDEPVSESPQIQSVPQPQVTPDQPPVPVAMLEYPADALRDGAYELKDESEIDEVIRALKSHNWYSQNPAITRIKSLRHHQFAAAEWFVLGRNIYQAACGSALKAVEFMRNLDIELGRHELESANHLLAGMLFEVYFNSEGQFRPRPKAGQIDSPFREVAKPNFEAAKTFIQARLQPCQNQLLILPGDVSPVELKVEATPVPLEGSDKAAFSLDVVTLQDISLLDTLEAADLASGDIKPWMFDTDWTLEKLKTELIESWVIPEWQIVVAVTPAIDPRAKLIPPKGARLSARNRLRPN